MGINPPTGRPIPVLLTQDDDVPAADENGGEDTATVDVGDIPSQDDVDSANTLATVGIAVGVLGLAVAVFALVRSRRSSGGPPSPNGSGTETEAATPAGTSSA